MPSAQALIGKLGIKISGCINACGHHHVGHIGILGLDKAGVENYQITLGGDPGDGPRSASGSARASTPTQVPTRSSGSSTPISTCAPATARLHRHGPPGRPRSVQARALLAEGGRPCRCLTAMAGRPRPVDVVADDDLDAGACRRRQRRSEARRRSVPTTFIPARARAGPGPARSDRDRLPEASATAAASASAGRCAQQGYRRHACAPAAHSSRTSSPSRSTTASTRSRSTRRRPRASRSSNGCTR